MTETEIIQLVRGIIREELTQILLAEISSNTDKNRSSITRFKSESPIERVRSIQPFGLASKAPAGTPTVAVPLNGDKTNMMALGNFDENRPEVEDGESAQYNDFGQEIRLAEDKITYGSKDAAENLVLGQVLKTLLTEWLTIDESHTHIVTVPGYPTLVPDQAAQYTAIKASPVEDEGILSDYQFTQKEP